MLGSCLDTVADKITKRRLGVAWAYCSHARAPYSQDGSVWMRACVRACVCVCVCVCVCACAWGGAGHLGGRGMVEGQSSEVGAGLRGGRGGDGGNETSRGNSTVVPIR